MATLRERVVSALTPPEVKKAVEALNQMISDASLLEEPGWSQMSGSGTGWDIDLATRQQIIDAAYVYWQVDPLASSAVRLIKDYTFGRGVSFRAPDERVSKVIGAFWHDRSNRKISRAEGQWELSERLQIAGELFFMFFVSRTTGRVQIRLIEPTEISQIITDPDDREKVLYYERSWTRQTFDWQSRAWTGSETVKDLIPSWTNLVEGGPDPYATVGDDKRWVCMCHMKINSHGLRGVPPYFRIIPWLKAYKGFMEDRVSLTFALATFAFKQKIKGSSAAVSRLAARWTNANSLRRYGVGAKEREPGAKTVVENENVTLDQISVDSGSGNAYLDGRMLRQQVSAGTGITEQNLTGDPSVSNLASATQMEGPQQKMFESWQQLFSDQYVDILEFVITCQQRWGELRGLTDVDTTVEVNMPPIVTKDLPVVVGAVAGLISAQSAAGVKYIPDRRLAGYLLEAFGETDIDTALKDFDKIVPQMPVPTQQAVNAAVAAFKEAFVEAATGLIRIKPKNLGGRGRVSKDEAELIAAAEKELAFYGKLVTDVMQEECPQATGETVRSIRWELVNKGSRNVELRVWGGNDDRPEVVIRTLLFGSKAHTIEPNGPWPLHFKAGGEDVYTYRVEHPGTQPDNFVERALKRTETERRAMAARLGALEKTIISKGGYRND